MSKGGNIQYKCRRCGVIYTRAHALDVAWGLQCAVFQFMEQPKEWGCLKIETIDIHPCSKGAWGVADLAGGVEDI